MDNDWLQAPYDPVEVSDVLMAFPGGVMHLMPAPEDIPAVDSKWIDFQSRWFGSGLPETTEVNVREGLSGEMCFRHLQCIQGSYQPKHQHKQAAVAYLASLWFLDIRY